MKQQSSWSVFWTYLKQRPSNWTAERWLLTGLFLLVLLVVFVKLPSWRKGSLTLVENKIYGTEIGNAGLRYKYGDYIYNPKTDEVLVDSIDWLYINDGDSIGILARNDRRAYINLNTAKLITPLAYDKAWMFACDRGVMARFDSIYVFRRDGSIVNKKGIHCERLYDLVFYRDHLILRTNKGKAGVLDTLANWALKPEYSKVEYDYQHHLFNTKKDEECIVYNDTLAIVLQGSYKEVRIDYSEGLIVTEFSGVQHLYSYKGEMLSNVIFASIKPLEYNTGREDANDNAIYDETECLVYVDYNGKCGLMDKRYRVLTPPMYNSIKAETKHLFFAAYGDYDDKFGTLIDDHGKQIH